MRRCAIALWALLASAAAAQERAPVVSARVSPERPAIGEPITVELRVRAAAGADVRFPAQPDSVEGIEPLDPRALRDASSGESVDRSAIYRLIAWDTGVRTPRFGDVTVVLDGNARSYRVSLPPLRIRSVLPADSSGRIPKPARAALAVGSGWWRIWVALAVALALLAFAWRARRTRVKRAPAEEDAARVADRGFAHAAASGLLEAGEPGRFALTHIEVLRAYLAARFPVAARSLTAREMTAALAQVEFPILPDRVGELLARAEEVAYARAPISADGAKGIAREALAMVKQVETALHARRVHAAQRSPKSAKGATGARGAAPRGA